MLLLNLSVCIFSPFLEAKEFIIDATTTIAIREDKIEKQNCDVASKFFIMYKTTYNFLILSFKFCSTRRRKKGSEKLYFQ